MLRAKLHELGGLLARATGNGRESTPGDGVDYERIDPDYLIRKLNIIDQATLHGQKGDPPPDTNALDSTEGTIRTHVVDAAAGAWEAYNAKFSALSGRLGSLSFWNQKTAIEETAKEYMREMGGNLHNAAERMHQLLDRMCETYNALEAFRQKHNLLREAKLNNAKTSYKVSMLAAIFIAEAVFNGIYIGNRVEGSIFVGLSISIGIALVNIGLGWFLGGMGVPRMRHMLPKNKRLGLAIVVLCSFGALALNLGVAHLRFVLGQAEKALQTAAAIAYERLMHTPFDIGDFMSLVLLFIGILCVLGAASQAYFWDEYYLEYADYTRRFLTARDELSRTRSDLINGVTDTCEDMRSRIRALRASVLSQIGTHRRMVKEMHELQGSYLEHIEYLHGVLNTVLRRYREMNTAARKGVPAPAHFRTDEPLEARKLEDLGPFNEMEPELKAIEEAVERDTPLALDTINREQDNAHKAIIKGLPPDLHPSVACRRQAVQRQHSGVGSGTEAGHAAP